MPYKLFYNNTWSYYYFDEKMKDTEIGQIENRVNHFVLNFNVFSKLMFLTFDFETAIEKQFEALIQFINFKISEKTIKSIITYKKCDCINKVCSSFCI